MHRAWWTAGFALIFVACDPMMYSSVRVAPAAAAGDTAHTEAQRGGAVAAVGRLASQFGLTPGARYKPECVDTWRAAGYRRGDGEKAPGNIILCVVLHADGEIELRIAETYSGRWSPKADSLRRAITDTLAQFGTVVSH